MGFTQFRICGMNFARSFYKHTSNSLKLLNISILGLIISACSGVETGLNDTQINNPDQEDSAVAITLEGSVGDGPVTEALITIKDAQGTVVGTTQSNSEARYTIVIPETISYPVVIEATGGTDIVSGEVPDFTMLSVAFDATANTVNINPYSTIIVKAAQAMPGGLNAANLLTAKLDVLDQLNFGLDPALIPDPITTSINETNVAAMIKASEAFGEVIRRTRSALLVSGSNSTGDDIITAIGGDMVDGVLDGRGPGASIQIAATANIMSGQVLVEALINQLKVNGAEATLLMDVAINLSEPNATMTTADVAITHGMLNQTRTSVAAAQTHTPSSNLSALALVLAGLSGNSMAADIEPLLQVDPGSAFNEVITQLPLSTDSQLEAVNTTVRSGAFQFAASEYTVGEDDGAVNITINRIGGSLGEVSVEWRTATFNGDGTADWANDYATFLWTERTLSFADGETSKVEQITINQDTVVEDDETFSVFIRTPAGNVVSTTIVTIVDDDIAAPVPEPIPEPVPEPVPEPIPEPIPEPTERPWENLIDEMTGFAKAANTTGGMGGEICWVNNLSNSGSGSLRDCAESIGSKWIRFSVSGVIDLSGSEIRAQSDKTIDGRGVNITISNGGIRADSVENIIVHNINFVNQSAGIPFINILRNTDRIWVDHLSFANSSDDALQIGTYGDETAESPRNITVSWCRWDNVGKALIIGFNEIFINDSVIKVTIHHNFFNEVVERTPSVRYAKVHAYNNYVYNSTWGSLASSQTAQLASEHNVLEAGSNTNQLYLLDAGIKNQTDTLAGFGRSTGDLLLGGSRVNENLPDSVFDPQSYYSYTVENADLDLKTRIMDGTGWKSTVFPE